ncbi:SixA phosphatase family protein [Catalinimonas niigatensis]|uniref:SixA phosphatase family protein n=1 Tax=Catalinimonas niigatensis TaxID=1397264 RepID=UPI0026668DAE|nr:histidine phosphatase family protein [Catalinimonas niigatensis]WPP49533.1 histidine phosphatase family protein [Catalinimonas niigatensis]
MKSLFLIRHAKSSWDDASLRDFDRPLNARGKKDAPMMGKRLRQGGHMPDLMLSSPAVRTVSTAWAIADALQYSREKILTLDDLYHASPSEILNVLRRTKDTVDTLFLFGHNPGLTDFANAVCQEHIDNIVTCGVYALQLEMNSWKALSLDKKAVLLFYDFPKNLT